VDPVRSGLVDQAAERRQLGHALRNTLQMSEAVVVASVELSTIGDILA
jgi:hypothetical protein